MKKAFIVLTLLISLSGLRSHAQSIGIDTLIFTPPFSPGDSSMANSNIFFTAVVKNYSSQMFGPDMIVLKYANDTAGTNGATLFPLNADQAYYDSIAPNDTIGLADTLFTNDWLFKNGINTVVIWPVTQQASGFVTQDSMKFNVYITDPLTINSVKEKDEITLYPNPFSDKIWLLTKGKTILEEVRITDALGKTIYTEIKPARPYVETHSLQPGIYFIELYYGNGAKRIIKTIKQ